MKQEDNLNYKCLKCGNRTYEVDEFRATGGFFAKIFDVQNKKFSRSPVPNAPTPKSIKQTLIRWEIFLISSQGNLILFFTKHLLRKSPALPLQMLKKVNFATCFE